MRTASKPGGLLGKRQSFNPHALPSLMIRAAGVAVKPPAVGLIAFGLSALKKHAESEFIVRGPERTLQAHFRIGKHYRHLR
jgi:hypothetical protein